MDVSIQGVIGRRLTAVAGETYRYKINCNSGLTYSVDGPGTAFNYVAQQQSPQEVANPSQSLYESIQNQRNQEQIQKTIQDAARFREQYDKSMKR